MKNRNPFKFGGKVEGYQFFDREESCRKLKRRLLDGSSNVVMYAPRRYGKTSLVAKVLRQLREEDGVNSVLFDLSRIPTLARFCEEYVNAVYAAVGGTGELVHWFLECLGNCNPTVSVNAGVMRIRLDLKNVFSETSIAEVLDLPEKMAQANGLEALVVAFDEFQEVAELSKEYSVEKIFRSCIQNHRIVRYVFFGSKQHLLQRMFGDMASPFYRSALQMPIGKPPVAESREFLRTRFADAGLFVDDGVIEGIVAASDNIPFYLQAYASLIFERMSDSGIGEAKPEFLDEAGEELMQANAAYFTELLNLLSEAQRLIVEAIARAPVAQFDEAYRSQHSLPSLSTVHSAVRELLKDGLIERDSGVYRLTDPLLARFVLASPAVIY